MKKTLAFVVFFLVSLVSSTGQDLEVIPQQRLHDCAAVCRFSPNDRYLVVKTCSIGQGGIMPFNRECSARLQVYDLKRKWLCYSFTNIADFLFYDENTLLVLGKKLQRVDLTGTESLIDLIPEKTFNMQNREWFLHLSQDKKRVVVSGGDSLFFVEMKDRTINVRWGEKEFGPGFKFVSLSTDGTRVLVKKQDRLVEYRLDQPFKTDPLMKDPDDCSQIATVETDSLLVIQTDKSMIIYGRDHFDLLKKIPFDLNAGYCIGYYPITNRLITIKPGESKTTWSIEPLKKLATTEGQYELPLADPLARQRMIIKGKEVETWNTVTGEMAENFFFPLPGEPGYHDGVLENHLDDTAFVFINYHCTDDMGFSHNGKYFAHTDADGRIYIRDAVTAKVMEQYENDKGFTDGYYRYTDKIERTTAGYSTLIPTFGTLYDYCHNHMVVIPGRENRDDGTAKNEYYLGHAGLKKDFFLRVDFPVINVYRLPDMNLVRKIDLRTEWDEAANGLVRKAVPLRIMNDLSVLFMLNDSLLYLTGTRQKPLQMAYTDYADPAYFNDSLFWSTNQRDSGILYAVNKNGIRELSRYGYNQQNEEIVIVETYDPLDPDLTRKKELHLVNTNHLAISGNAKWLAQNSKNGYFDFICLKDRGQSKKLRVIKDTTCRPLPCEAYLTFIPWNEDVFLAVYDHSYFFWDITHERLLTSLNLPDDDLWDADHYFDVIKKEILIVDSKRGKLLVIEGKNFSVTEKQIGKSESMVGYNFFNATIANDNRQAYYALYNTQTSEQIKLYTAGEDFLLINASNYYMTSGPKFRDLVFKYRQKYYSFEQFDLKYNRPDLVMRSMGCTDTLMQEAYRQAYLKRLKKMNFTEDMLKEDLHLPELEIKNFEHLPQVTSFDTISLNLQLNDSKYELDRINVWINDVAIFGTKGISLRELHTQSAGKKILLALTKGKNKVQLSVLNQAGAESYKETYEVNCEKGKTKPNLYIMAIGDSKYMQADYNLTYAAKDARDLVHVFEHDQRYGKVYVRLLEDKQVTKENIKALRNFAEQAEVNDEVILFVAGHGVLDKNLNYYLATYKMDFTYPEKEGIAYEELESLLDGIRPLKKILMIDACHSGEIDREEVELTQTNTSADGQITFRNVGPAIRQKSNTIPVISRETFTDLRKGTGATVIASASGVEFAMESQQWKNGLFTYCLLNGLKNNKADANRDGKIMLSELQQYLNQEVMQLSNGKQTPVSRMENISVDYQVW